MLEHSSFAKGAWGTFLSPSGATSDGLAFERRVLDAAPGFESVCRRLKADLSAFPAKAIDGERQLRSGERRALFGPFSSATFSGGGFILYRGACLLFVGVPHPLASFFPL